MDVRFPNIRYLVAFREVAVLKRIGLASDRVHLSQPAITQGIAKLERTYGARLFERRSDGMFLTEIGEILNHRVGRVLEHLQTGAQLALKRAPRGLTKGRRGFHKLVTPVQLQALVAVSRAGSYSHAAREIGAKQPAVHRAARELEKLAGVAFFEPVRRGVALTPSAEGFVHHVRLAAAELRQSQYEITAHLGQDSTRITIGSLPLSRTAILPATIHEMLETDGPGLQFASVDGPYPTLLRALRYGEIDFIIGALRDPSVAEDVTQEPLFADRLSVVTRVGHPLTQMTNPTYGDTLKYPWIAPPRETPSGSYLFETLGIHEMAETPVRIVSSSLMLIRGLMQRGDYVTVISENQFTVERAQGILTSVPIGMQDNARPIGLTFRAGWQPTPTQGRFLDLIRDFCRREYGDPPGNDASYNKNE